MSVGLLGRKLGATYVLSGSVRASVARMHLVLELTHTPTGRIAWAHSYERARTTLLSLQATVAAAVAEAVLGSLTVAERQQLAAGMTQSEEAFSHIARGLAFLARRLLPAAISELQAATRADITSAAAWSGLAQAYALCVFLGPQSAVPCTARADSLRPLAVAAAARAVTLDSTLSDAWLADALTRLTGVAGRSDYPRAMASLRRAEELGGRSAELLHTIGTVALSMGLDEQAIRYLRDAVVTDPGRGVTFIYLSRVAWVQGRYRDALALLDTAQTLEPEWDIRADRWRVLMALGDTARIRSAWTRLSDSFTGGRESDPTEVERRIIEEGLIRLSARDTTLAISMADSLLSLRSRSPWTALLLVRLARRADASSVVTHFAPPGAASWMGVRSPAFLDLLTIPEFRAYLDDARRAAVTSPQ